MKAMEAALLFFNTGSYCTNIFCVVAVIVLQSNTANQNSISALFIIDTVKLCSLPVPPTHLPISLTSDLENVYHEFRK